MVTLKSSLYIVVEIELHVPRENNAFQHDTAINTDGNSNHLSYYLTGIPVTVRNSSTIRKDAWANTDGCGRKTAGMSFFRIEALVKGLSFRTPRSDANF